MLRHIEDYHDMQYQVNHTPHIRENGQKPHFWLFFAHLMHIMHTYLIVYDLKPLPDVKKNLGLPSYAILSQSELPKSRK